MPLTLDDFRKPPVLPAVRLTGTLGKVVFRHYPFKTGEGGAWYAEATISDVEVPDPTSEAVISEALEDQGWEGEVADALASSYFRWKPAVYQGKNKPKSNRIVEPTVRDDDGTIEAYDVASKSFKKVNGKAAEEQEIYNINVFLKKLRDVYRVAEQVVGDLPSVEPLLEDINEGSPSVAVGIFEKELLYATEGTRVTFQVTQEKLEDGRIVNGVGSVVREG